MKQFDEIGLNLAKVQGNLFVESINRYECSSAHFIKVFMNSEICAYIDKYEQIDIAGVFDELESKHKLSTGNEKFNVDNIYWIGYLYRYWAYRYETNSKNIYKIINARQLNELYDIYHTLDPDVAIERIYEAKNITSEKDYLSIIKRIYLL